MNLETNSSNSPSSSALSTTNHKRKTTRHPSYRGVRRRNSGKWVSEVRDPNNRSRIWLGTFPNPEMAAAAHDAAVLALRGEGAMHLNFPDTAHRLPRAASPFHADIQRTALQAARDFDFTLASSSSSSSFAGEFDSHHENKDEGKETPVEFVDEEAMFNMPLLLDCMAEGMLLTPPALKKGFSWNLNEDDYMDFTIWPWGD